MARMIKDAFWSVCTIPVGAIDRLTTPEQRKTFMSEERSGSRTVKAVSN
jgi:hypothetical protein